MSIDRRSFIAGAATAAFSPAARAASTADLKPVVAEIEKRHDEIAYEAKHNPPHKAQRPELSVQCRTTSDCCIRFAFGGDYRRLHARSLRAPAWYF